MIHVTDVKIQKRAIENRAKADEEQGRAVGDGARAGGVDGQEDEPCCRFMAARFVSSG
jgi:hypothetical protein